MTSNIRFWSYLAQFLDREMFQTKVIQKVTKHVLHSATIFNENRAVYEIMWKNIVQPDRPQMTIWRMRIACWIPKATNTDSRVSNTNWISTTTMDAWKYLNVKLYVHCVSSVLIIFLHKRHTHKCSASNHYSHVHVNHRVLSDDHETYRWNTVAIILQWNYRSQSHSSSHKAFSGTQLMQLDKLIIIIHTNT
jgi:hypothetical protein